MILNSIPELQQALGRDLVNFFPELLLCIGILLMLLMRLFNTFDWVHLSFIALVTTVAALWVSLTQWQSITTAAASPEPMFSGLLVYDAFTVYLRLFLLGFLALVVWLTMLTGIPDREDSGDFYTLLLGATVGMMLMASANHLLMIFIGIEMASVPSYAMAGFLKGRRQSSEASLKYVVYGGGAAGIMLYGISLLAGKFGTGYLPDLATAYAAALPTEAVYDPILILGTLFILIGVAFKLAAFPFHFWCPDVFEGASAEVAGFLSVASKGAALALLARFVLMLNGLGGDTAPDYGTWLKVTSHLAPVIALFAALTATFGNLAAYLQTNLKRLLAYSTIAHAGYMMMGLAPMNREGTAAVLVYLVAYLFMNLGAFAAVAFLRNLTGSEDLSSFRGLVRRAPCLVITLAIFLLSLLGIPPLAGFPAKFQIFAALFHSGESMYAQGHTWLGGTLIALLVVAGLNTVLSVFLYLKVVKVMILDQPLEEIEGRTPEPLPETGGMQLYLGLLSAAIVAIGVYWGPIYQAGQSGVSQFQAAPGAPVVAVSQRAEEQR